MRFLQWFALSCWIACSSIGAGPVAAQAAQSRKPSAEQQIEAAHATYFEAVRSGKLAGMAREERLLLLLASLTGDQWRSAVGADGLGLGQVSEVQAPLFLSFAPDPFITRASTLKSAARSMFGRANRLTPEQRREVRLRLRRAVVLTLIEAGGAGSGRVFHNLGPEGESAIVAQDTPSAKEPNPPRLTTGQIEALNGLVVTKATASVGFGVHDPFIPRPELLKKLEAAWRTATGMATVETPIEDLLPAQRERILERVGLWNAQNPGTPLEPNRVRLRLELVLDYVMPDGTVVIRPVT